MYLAPQHVPRFSQVLSFLHVYPHISYVPQALPISSNPIWSPAYYFTFFLTTLSEDHTCEDSVKFPTFRRRLRLLHHITAIISASLRCLHSFPEARNPYKMRHSLHQLSAQWRRLLYVLIAHGCTNPVHQIAITTDLYTFMPNIFGSRGWNLLHVILLRPRILRWLLAFRKLFESLLYTKLPHTAHYNKTIRPDSTSYWQ